MRETPLGELGPSPARRVGLVAIQRDRETVDLQTADAEAECAGVAAFDGLFERE